MGNDADLWSRNCEPSPSLFTFNIKDPRIKNYQVCTCNQVKDTKLESTGPLIDTHWGMSGPAVLKLSAWEQEFYMTKLSVYHICKLVE
jgi:predicted flavoprotein YhiN